MERLEYPLRQIPSFLGYDVDPLLVGEPSPRKVGKRALLGDLDFAVDHLSLAVMQLVVGPSRTLHSEVLSSFF